MGDVNAMQVLDYVPSVLASLIVCYGMYRAVKYGCSLKNKDKFTKGIPEKISPYLESNEPNSLENLTIKSLQLILPKT